MHIQNVAVIGPGGNVGSAIIKALLKEGDRFQITAISRQSSTYTAPSSAAQLKTISTDFNDSQSLVQALHGQDAVVCCVPGGATHFKPQKSLIDAAIEARVKLFLPSEFISDIMSPHFQIFPTDFVGDKVKVRRYLEEKASAGEIAWTALNGGPFFDMWLHKGVAGFDIPARRATIYGAGTNPSCWTPLPVIAHTVTTMLKTPNPVLNRPIFICGVLNITQNNILAALEAEIGVDFHVEHVDVKRIKQDALESLERGEWRLANRGLALNSQFNEEDGWADFSAKVENELVGVEAVDVRDAVREFLTVYGY